VTLSAGRSFFRAQSDCERNSGTPLLLLHFVLMCSFDLQVLAWLEACWRNKELLKAISYDKNTYSIFSLIRFYRCTWATTNVYLYKKRLFMIEFKSKVEKVLPYDRQDYIDFLDDDAESSIKWYGH
jgi:hypothetical protein